MKYLFILIVSLLLANPLIAYNSVSAQRTFDLKERNDKLVVVLNQYGSSRISVENGLKNLVSKDDEVKEAISNIYTINFKGTGSELKMRSALAKFSSRNDLIKFAAPVYHGSSSDITVVCADEFIVRLKNSSDKPKLDFLNEKNGIDILGNIRDNRGFYLKTKNGISKTSIQLSDEYFQSGLFEYCEPNYIYPEGNNLCFTPNDTRFGGQWNLNNTGQTVRSSSSSNGDVTTFNGLQGSDMNVPEAWDYTLGSAAVEIGVFDSGIDSTHPDFAGNVLTGYDAVTNSYGVPLDSLSFGHGTNCAGIIGAVTNNNLGVAGIAGGCKIRSYKIYTSSGTTSSVIQSRAFDSATTAGLHVISCSWTATVNSTLTAAINNCAVNGRGGLGCIILFGSGNDGKNAPSYPSYLSNVVSVGSSTPYDQMKSPGTGNQFRIGGNYGEDGNGDVDCVAPSIVPTVDIQSTGGDNDSAGVAGNYSMVFGGTSASCANAAGVAALVLSINTSQTGTQVIGNLLRGCDKIENIDYAVTKTYGKWSSYMAYGRLNAFNSVRLAAGVDITPPTINHLAVESHSSTYPTHFTAEVIDQDGSTLDTAITKPKVIYRTNKNNAGWTSFDSVNFITKTGDTYTFRIPGQGWETQVQYYIKAKDNTGNTSLFPIHAPDTTNLCYYAVASLESVTQKVPSFSLPSSGTATSSNVTFSSFKILKTKVRLHVQHQANVVYKLILVNPNSNSSFNRKCIFANNGPLAFTTGITNATAVDSASQFWSQGIDPFTNGFYKPDYFFRGYNGLDAGGNWNILYFNSFNVYTGTADSIFITLYKSTGTTSPSARLDSPSDSTMNFGTTDFVDTVDFYLKNKGNANLIVSGASFSGTYASKYSLLSSLPGAIAPSDSGLFRVRCNPLAKPPRGNEILLDGVENATMDIATNDPSKSTFKVSLQSDTPLPVELSNFTSTADRNNVKLNWSTISEINNKGFEVQRANENYVWSILSFITGNGNSNQINNYSFEDRNVNTGKYHYRLKQIDYNGNFKYYNLLNEVIVGLPTEFALMQNYPNPFNPSTTINFDLPVDAKVNLLIYDITGRLVNELLNSEFKAGYNSVKFNATNFSSGVYFYTINASSGTKDFVQTKRMILVK
ncbi:MAG: S8 family serine peptidase [Ignavibacteria bacterium]|nr:S8 family serine peptidase [Ignavibacteria bacterium]